MTFYESLIAAGMTIVAFVIFAASVRNCSTKHDREIDCNKKCKVFVSKIIEDKCYCASDTGFIVPKETFPLQEL